MIRDSVAPEEDPEVVLSKRGFARFNAGIHFVGVHAEKERGRLSAPVTSINLHAGIVESSSEHIHHARGNCDIDAAVVPRAYLDGLALPTAAIALVDPEQVAAMIGAGPATLNQTATIRAAAVATYVGRRQSKGASGVNIFGLASSANRCEPS